MDSKCRTCEMLNLLRSTTVGGDVRRNVRSLHALHKSAYMGERLAYYGRRQFASNHPELCWSIIIDGMQQSHSVIPHLANNQAPSSAIKFKLVGALTHCKPKQQMSFYRMARHIKGGVNPNLHAFLLELERLHSMFGYLPKTIYLQIDGCVDNVGKTFLGIVLYCIVLYCIVLYCIVNLFRVYGTYGG